MTPGARRAVGWAVGLALAVRLGLVAAGGTWHVPDDRDHWAFGYENGRIARSIVEGHGFASPYGTGEPSAWMPPLYPFVMAAAFTLLGVESDAAALLLLALQSLAGAASVALLAGLAARWLGTRAAVAAAFAWALYPAAVYLSAGMIWPSAPAVLLVLAALRLGAAYRERGGAEHALGAGLVLGLLALLDPVCLALAPGLALEVWRGPAPAARRLRAGLVALVGLAVVVAPWLARNRLAFGEWVFLKSNFGHELWLGNNPHATGFWLDAEGRSMKSHLDPELVERVEARGEPALSRWYGERARDWMRDNPGRVAALSLRRAGWFWWRVDFPAVRAKGERVGGAPARLALAVAWRGAVLLGAAGIVLALARRRPVGSALLFLLLYPASYYLTHMSNYRYRHPVEPLLVMFAAGLVELVPRRDARS